MLSQGLRCLKSMLLCRCFEWCPHIAAAVPVSVQVLSSKLLVKQMAAERATLLACEAGVPVAAVHKCALSGSIGQQQLLQRAGCSMVP